MIRYMESAAPEQVKQMYVRASTVSQQDDLVKAFKLWAMYEIIKGEATGVALDPLNFLMLVEEIAEAVYSKKYCGLNNEEMFLTFKLIYKNLTEEEIPEGSRQHEMLTWLMNLEW